ncbi:uncharacterized protein LOC132341481 isoform X2 [Haemorhous mexicanus]|uniref:uncharacterized protein LOC132341481 isoform X2 n=1 Tax=Haemorhous mexicanus TaxID=30427 RepID=UPI0028BF50A0|nr:uncharacterized protein LOC132341481 isoform X2 [Haemorhous mexicanus]
MVSCACDRIHSRVKCAAQQQLGERGVKKGERNNPAVTKPMEVHGRAEIHLQPVEDPTPETCDTVGDPCRISLLLKDCTSWKGPMLERFVKNCSPWERPTLKKSVMDYIPWEGPHAGVGEEREEEGAAEAKHYEPTAASIPHHPVLLGKGGGGVEESGVKLRLGRREK